MSNKRIDWTMDPNPRKHSNNGSKKAAKKISKPVTQKKLEFVTKARGSLPERPAMTTLEALNAAAEIKAANGRKWLMSMKEESEDQVIANKTASNTNQPVAATGDPDSLDLDAVERMLAEEDAKKPNQLEEVKEIEEEEFIEDDDRIKKEVMKFDAIVRDTPKIFQAFLDRITPYSRKLIGPYAKYDTEDFYVCHCGDEHNTSPKLDIVYPIPKTSYTLEFHIPRGAIPVVGDSYHSPYPLVYEDSREGLDYQLFRLLAVNNAKFGAYFNANNPLSVRMTYFIRGEKKVVAAWAKYCDRVILKGQKVLTDDGTRVSYRTYQFHKYDAYSFNTKYSMVLYEPDYGPAQVDGWRLMNREPDVDYSPDLNSRFSQSATIQDSSSSGWSFGGASGAEASVSSNTNSKSSEVRTPSFSQVTSEPISDGSFIPNSSQSA